MEDFTTIKTFLEKQNPIPEGICFSKNNLGKKIINKKEINLSIIIPCYNVEKYVKECYRVCIKSKN